MTKLFYDHIKPEINLKTLKSLIFTRDLLTGSLLNLKLITTELVDSCIFNLNFLFKFKNTCLMIFYLLNTISSKLFEFR